MEEGMAVSISGTEYTLGSLSASPESAGDEFDEYALYVGGIQRGEWLYTATLSGPYAEGIHSAEITVDSVTPMSFVVN